MARPGIKVELPPAEQLHWKQLMLAMQKKTGRSLRAVTFATTKDFLYAAQRASRIAPTHADETARNDRVFAFIRLKSGEVRRRPVTLETAKKHGLQRVGSQWKKATYTNSGKRRIDHRGFLKSGWSGCMRKLGIRRRSRGKAVQSAATSKGERMLNEVRKSASPYRPWFEVANQIPFADKYETEIMPRAMYETATRMWAKLNDIPMKEWRELWNRPH